MSEENMQSMLARVLEDMSLERKEKCLTVLYRIKDSLTIQSKQPDINIHLKPPYKVIPEMEEVFKTQYKKLMHDMTDLVDDVIKRLPDVESNWTQLKLFVSGILPDEEDRSNTVNVLTEKTVFSFKLNEFGGVDTFSVNGKGLWTYIFQDIVKKADVEPAAFFNPYMAQRIKEAYGLADKKEETAKEQHQKAILSALVRMLELLNNEKSIKLKQVFSLRSPFIIPNDYIWDVYNCYVKCIDEYIALVEKVQDLVTNNFEKYEKGDVVVISNHPGYHPSQVRRLVLETEDEELCFNIDEGKDHSMIYVGSYSMWHLAMEKFRREPGLGGDEFGDGQDVLFSKGGRKYIRDAKKEKGMKS